jgi:F-type H+-transporting ATPase subunit b
VHHIVETLALISMAAAEGGFNPLDLAGNGGFFWTLIIFLAALAPIWIVVMKPVTRALLERDAKASEAIEKAQAASRDAESAKNAVEARLREANAQAAALMSEARARAEEVEKNLKEQAAREAGAMLERAKAEIKAEQDKALSAIRAEVVEVSLKAASQVISRKIDATDDRRLVDELVGAAAGGRK